MEDSRKTSRLKTFTRFFTGFYLAALIVALVLMLEYVEATGIAKTFLILPAICGVTVGAFELCAKPNLHRRIGGIALAILIIVMIFERIFQPNWILAAYMCAHFLLAAVHTLCSHIIICSERSDQKREQELQLQKRTQAEIEERHWEECMVSIVRKELVDLGVIDDDSVFDALKQFNYIRTEDELTKAIRYFNSLIYDGQVPTEEKPNPPFPESAEPKQTNIPHFWPTIFGNLTLIAANINEADKPLMEDLINLRCTIFKEPRGFELKFVFRENQYFTNEVLRKKFDYSDSNGEKCLSVDRVVGCNIVWKTGKNLTLNEGQKSFFNFFESPNANTDVNTSDFEFSKQLLMAMAVFNMPSIGIADDDE